MENRLKSFKTVSEQTAGACCLKQIEENYMVFPGRGISCRRCGTHLKCAWLDFNKSFTYALGNVYSHENRLEDFVALSAVVLRSNVDTDYEFNRRVTHLKDVVTAGIEGASEQRGPSGVEYVFNKVAATDTRILRVGANLYVVIGKVSDEARAEKDIIGVTFSFGNGPKVEGGQASFALSGGIVPANPSMRPV